MEYDIVRMQFRRPLHLGQESESVEATEQMCHSDTLFSAICHSWLRLYGHDSLEEMLNTFWEAGEEDIDPPFCLSSAFPFIKSGDDYTYYLPKPQIPPSGVDIAHERYEEVAEDMKSLDDADWINKRFFEDWIAVDKKPTSMEDALTSLEVHFKKLEDELQRKDEFMGNSVRPRVALDPVSSESRLFFFGSVVFRKGSGLYFLVKWKKAEREKWEGRLRGAMELLGDIGLGGERSSGYGGFRPKWGTLDIKLPEETTNGLITLSLWYPNSVDINQGIELGRYTLIPRAGWASSPRLRKAYRRKVVAMFAEGSSVKCGETSLFSRTKINGCLVDVTPDDIIRDNGHRIYKYGFAFTLRAKIPEP